MKMLVISPRFPRAGGKADSMTVFKLVEHFSRNHEVILACFYDKESELKELGALEALCKEVRFVKRKPLNSYLQMLSAPFRGLPLQTAYYYSREMMSVVRELLNIHKPDLAYAHLIRTSEYLKDVQGPKRVLALQIAQTLNYRRMFQHIADPFYKILYSLEYWIVRKYEPRITKYYDSCLLISKYDKEALLGHEAIENIFYSPHGVDFDKYRRDQSIPYEAHSMLFCGVLETPTNLDAVLYFYREIYPLIKKRVPAGKLYLLGKNPPKAIQKIAEEDSSVIVTGFVPDLTPFYSKVQVGIDPLRIGAGMQNKLLVGMCMEQAMVSTSIANEGIGAKDGEHLLIADTPQDFANRVIELLNNPEYASKIGKQSRHFVEKQWGWEYHFNDLENHFSKLTSGMEGESPSTAELKTAI